MNCRRMCLLGAAIAAVGITNRRALAQTWVAATGSWSNAANWNALPTPDDGTALMFPMTGAGTLAYTATNDLPGGFTLNSVVIQGLAGGSLTLGSGGMASLRFDGLAPSLSVAVGGNLLVNSRVSVAAGPLQLSPAPGGSITFAQSVASTGGLNIGSIANGTVSLLAENRIGGNISVTNSALNLGSVNSIADATLTIAGGKLSIGPSTFATAPDRAPYFRNQISAGSGGLILGDNRSFTLTGSISGVGGVTISPTALSIGTWTLAGNNTFSGPVTINQAPGSTPGIYNMAAVTSPAGLGNASQISLNGTGAAIGFAAAGAYTVSKPIAITAGGTVGVLDAGGRADITLDQPISGTGGLNRIGTGVLTLSGNNTFAGGLTLAGGYTSVASDAALGAAGSTITLAGGSIVVGPAVNTLSRNILVGNVTGGTLYNDGSINFTGSLSNATVTPSGFIKSGLGTFLIASTTANIGSAVINGGAIHLGGAGGRLLATGTVAVNQGGALVIDHTATTNAKISSSGAIALSGATVRVIGNATLNTSVVSSGALTLGSTTNSGQGLTVLQLDPNPARNTAVRFGSLSRTANNGVHVVFSGAGLGSSTIASAAAGQSNFSFTTAPTAQLVNGILPYAVIDQGLGKEFVSYSAANGIIPATYTTATINVGTATTDNVAVGSDTILAPETINSIKFTGGTVNLAAGTLSVSSGAMLFTGPTTITGGTLTIGVGTNNTTQAPTANFFTYADVTIASRVFVFTNAGAGVNSGIAKSGPGVLTLSNTASSWGGPTRLIEGTFRLGSNNIISNESPVVMSAAATLDMNGFTDTIGSISDAKAIDPVGSYATGTINLGASTLNLGTDNSSTTSHHNIVGNGVIVKNGTGTFTVTGNQAMTGRVIVGGGTLSLGTHYQTGTGFNNVSTISLGVTGISGDVGLRFEDGFRGYTQPITVQAQAGRTATLAFADSVGGTLSSPIALNNAQGLFIDAAGGPTVAGAITGNGQLITTSTGVGTVDSRHYSVRISGNNSTIGTVTLAAPATVFSSPTALGGATPAILLGSSNGADNPELSGDVGGISLAKSITVQGSTSAAAKYAIIGSRVPDGGGTLTYAQPINVTGSRSKLILFSNGEPLRIDGSIIGAAGTSVQIGHDFSADDVTTRGTVILSGFGSFSGGTSLAAGTLGIGGTTSTVGSGTFNIGVGTIAPSHEPTIVGATVTGLTSTGTINAATSVNRNFRVANLAGMNASSIQFSQPVQLGNTPRVITIEQNAGISFIGSTGLVSGSAGGVIKAGPGRMELRQTSPLDGSLIADEGTVLVQGNLAVGNQTHAGAAGRIVIDDNFAASLKTTSLSIDSANGGAVDVTGRGLIVDYAGASPLTRLTGYVASGFSGGAWTGTGIRSSNAAADHTTAVGIIEASDTGVTNFLGQPFVGDAVLVRYVLSGDTNLDGTVNLDDFTNLAAGFGLNGRWYTGDFDYSGHVDLDDFTSFAANFGLVLPTTAPRGAAVPEPFGGAAALAMGALSLGRRRYRSESMRNSRAGKTFCD